MYADVKLSLIDLEVDYTTTGRKGHTHRERLSERDASAYAIVQTTARTVIDYSQG